jgi:hypothetical protein
VKYENTKYLTAIISSLSVMIAFFAVASSSTIAIIILISAIFAGASAFISISYSKRLSIEREKNRIFIIYAREDLNSARKLWQDLKDRGFNPWLDVEEILPGAVWRKSVLQSLEMSAAAVVLISENLKMKRGFAQKEVKAALEVLQERGKGESPLIPIRLNDTSVPKMLSHIQWVDLFENDGLDRLEVGLKRITS